MCANVKWHIVQK